MIARVRRVAGHQHGQSLLEYAIGLNVLLLLVLGTVDLGRGVWAYNTLAHLAREGARYGSAPSKTAAEIQAYVASRATLPDFGESNVTVTRGTCGVEDQPVVVTTTYQFDSITPLISNAWGGGPLTLRASSRMYVERGVPGVGACP